MRNTTINQGRWLTEQAHPSDDVLVVQVASTEIDNNYW